MESEEEIKLWTRSLLLPPQSSVRPYPIRDPCHVHPGTLSDVSCQCHQGLMLNSLTLRLTWENTGQSRRHVLTPHLNSELPVLLGSLLLSPIVLPGTALLLELPPFWEFSLFKSCIPGASSPENISGRFPLSFKTLLKNDIFLESP